MQKQNNRLVGSRKEAVAAAYLKEQGVQILASNFRIRNGEIDLIGKDGDYLAFIEVKYRSNAHYGLPQEAVHYKKQAKICRVADYYRMYHHMPACSPVRFDVVGICPGKIIWIRNAFPYVRR